jgi:hypothetical protein
MLFHFLPVVMFIAVFQLVSNESCFISKKKNFIEAHEKKKKLSNGTDFSLGKIVQD